MNQAKVPRVLIADDEKHMRILMKTAITKMNYQVIGLAANGHEAIALYKQEQPDILLLDINMPSKTGDAALQEIIDQFPDALVIMLTAVAEMEMVEKCISLGAANYIRKDTPISEIAQIIKNTWQAAH